MMNKQLPFISIIFLGVCILIGSWLISNALDTNGTTPSEEQYRYEFISANEHNIIIFDKQTGEYWRKYIEINEGPTNWEKQDSPMNEKNN